MTLKERICALAILSSLCACAGPTTPFGSNVWVDTKFKARIPASGSDAQISSFPKSQLYHSPFDLVLQIKDLQSIPKSFRYDILYNGKKVERWWRGEKIIFDQRDPRIANIVFEKLSLLPGRQNEITFLYYRDEKSDPVAYTFGPPQCPLRLKTDIASISPFRSLDLSVAKIEKIAADNEINPSLLAGLVAQESGFNPFAISWAKAVGLTQITSLANQEILALKPDWQYDKSVEKLSFLQLKTSILTNRITPEQDWRLDQIKSLEGGSIYLNLLSQYWEKEEALGALEVFKSRPPMTDILLASYNSGAYRVKKSILREKENWLKSKELNEARKYVMNIKSYCHAFAEK